MNMNAIERLSAATQCHTSSFNAKIVHQNESLTTLETSLGYL